MQLGPTIYFALGTFGKLGTGNIGEDMNSFDDAVNAVAEYLKDREEGSDFAVLRVDFTDKPNLPECTTDVTEEVRDELERMGVIVVGEVVDDAEHERQERHSWEQV